MGLHAASKARTAKWQNTIAGQQRKRVLDISKQAELEEAEREAVEKALKEEDEQYRQSLLERAERAAFAETDLVKTLHSKVMMQLVLDERDRQIEHQRARKQIEAEQEAAHTAEVNRKSVMDAIQKQSEELDFRRKQAELKRDLDNHMAVRRELLVAEQKSDEAEVLAILEADNAALAAQRHGEYLRRLKAEQAQEELLRLQAERTRSQNESRLREQEDEERAKLWVTIKSKQIRMKKDIEKKRDSQRLRETIGNMQKQEHDEADKKLERQIAKYIQEKDESARLEEEAAAAKKRKQTQDSKEYYRQHILAVEEQKVQRKLQQDQAHEENVRLHNEFLSSEKKRKEDLLRIGKDLQDFNIKKTVSDRVLSMNVS
ncbi:hypothetical protein BJ742DRAFT_868082 [Cladochytrium replicatum]|nr:hypothetical protein BJ742DRAFT_868082 [Cladochytrium replicatum]